MTLRMFCFFSSTLYEEKTIRFATFLQLDGKCSLSTIWVPQSLFWNLFLRGLLPAGDLSLASTSCVIFSVLRCSPVLTWIWPARKLVNKERSLVSSLLDHTLPHNINLKNSLCQALMLLLRPWSSHLINDYSYMEIHKSTMNWCVQVKHNSLNTNTTFPRWPKNKPHEQTDCIPYHAVRLLVRVRSLPRQQNNIDLLAAQLQVHFSCPYNPKHSGWLSGSFAIWNSKVAVVGEAPCLCPELGKVTSMTAHDPELVMKTP